MRDWSKLLIGEANPFRSDLDGLRPVELDEASFLTALEADTIRRGQRALILSRQLEAPVIHILRTAEGLERLARVGRILSLNPDRARALLEQFKAMNG